MGAITGLLPPRNGSAAAAIIRAHINEPTEFEVLVIDDPIKNAEEADSADIREKIWDWFGSTAYTRLAPGGGVLVIQTWWHDDDLAGRLQVAMQEEDADQYVVIKYPALAEHDEYLDEETDLIEYDAAPARGRLLRKKGEALHPERFDEQRLARIKKTLPTRFWSALYQQNPVPDDGGYFTKANFRRSVPPQIRKAHVYVTVDFAISEKKLNDYTVIGCGLQDESDMLHIADMYQFKSGDALFITDAILTMCNRWYSRNMVLGVEDGQIWKTMATVFSRRMAERVKNGTLSGYIPIEVLKPLTDKLVRARPLQARMQQGLVAFPVDAPWFMTAQNEMLRFPAGKHDDIVDCFAWMAQLMGGKSAPKAEKDKALKSWKDKLSRITAEGGGQSAMTA